MKPCAVALQLALLLAAALAFGGRAFCQQAGPQLVRAFSINPATGLPVTPGGPVGIDPATGLPLPAPRIHCAPRTRSAPPDTGSLSPLSRARELMDRGRFEEALQCCLSENIRTQALALLDDPRLQSVVSDAETNTRQ
jgi:hypothetical protein